MAASHRRALMTLKWTGIPVGVLIALLLLAVTYGKLFLP